MKDLLKLLALQLAAAVGVYLLLFLLGETLSFMGWLIIPAAIILFLFRKRSENGLWWWEKAKRKVMGVVFSAGKRTGGRP